MGREKVARELDLLHEQDLRVQDLVNRWGRYGEKLWV